VNRELKSGMASIYLDANATTPLLPEVVDAMAPFWTTHFGNPSSVHRQGQHARSAIEHAREAVARFLRCRPSEIIFTSGGTEGNNLALFGTLRSGSHLITTEIEHHAILHAAKALEQREASSGGPVEVTYLPPTASGRLDPASLHAALQPNTRLVSIMLANNETGVIQPVRELADIAHAAGALFHTDAIQGAGKLPLSVDELGCDLLTIAGHKMYAPKGVGALYVRRKTQLAPMLFGGSHERQRRAGTENVPGIVALGRAAELAGQWLTLDDPGSGPTSLARLRDRLEAGLLAAIPRSGVNGARADGHSARSGLTEPRTPNTSNLYFDGVDAEALVIALDLKGIAVSAGSACQSGATEPSHVLTAMRLPEARARASIRISLSRLNTEDEIDTALHLIPATVARLRQLAARPHIPQLIAECRNRTSRRRTPMPHKPPASLADPNQLPSYNQDNVLQVVIETPKGSRNKYTFDPERGVFTLKKVLPIGMVFPFDFGFVPSTIAGDGDAIDVLVLMDEPAFPGCVLDARLIGVIEGEDLLPESDGGGTRRNDRLLAVACVSHLFADIHEAADLPRRLLDSMEEFFVSYPRLLSGKTFKSLGCKNRATAVALVEQARQQAADSAR